MEPENSTLEVLSVQGNMLGYISIYPNPSKGILNISSKEPLDITIIDLLGK